LADRLVATKDPIAVAQLKNTLERGFYGDPFNVSVHTVDAFLDLCQSLGLTRMTDDAGITDLQESEQIMGGPLCGLLLPSKKSNQSNKGDLEEIMITIRIMKEG
jgi:hypothetical protein